MSGPKSSVYILTAVQLLIIKEEQERIRKELEERARKERERKEAEHQIRSIMERMNRHLASVRDREKTIRSQGILMAAADEERFRHFYSEIKKLDQLYKMSSGKDHATLIEARTKAKQISEELALQSEGILQFSRDLQLKEQLKQDSRIAEGMKLSFASVGAIEENVDLEKEETTAELRKMMELDVSEELHHDIEEAIRTFNSIEDKNARTNYRMITVEALRKRCIAYISFSKKNGEKYYSLLDSYRVLCEQLGHQIMEFAFNEEGLKSLEAKVTEYKNRLQFDAEQRYISQSIDEVMSEMGYEVIGHRHVEKKSGKSFTSKLLSYEDGTVVNITECNNGQITMEIGGTDDKDRLPDTNERVALRKTMESFCQDFKKIESRLAEKGVILNNRISMAPPLEEYAQIINCSEYELVDDYQMNLSKKRTIVQEKSNRQVRND